MTGTARSPEGPSRLVALDGLRGLAALIVLLFHFEQFHGTRGPFALGYMAVDFFFLLSGFVLVGPIENDPTGGRTSGTSKFVVRVLRFWPLMALGTLIGAGVQWLRWPADQVLPLLALGWLGIPLAWRAGHAFALNGPQWSLFVELICNALHLALLRKTRTSTLLLLSLICGVVLGFGERQLSSLTVGANYDDILVGLLRAAFAYPLGIAIGRNRRLLAALPLSAPWVAPAALLATVLMPAWVGMSDAVAETFSRVAFVAVLALGVRTRTTPSATRIMTWLGALSFPLYAIHVPIIDLADQAARAAPAGWSGPIFLGGLVLSLALAELIARSPLARGIRLPVGWRFPVGAAPRIAQGG